MLADSRQIDHLTGQLIRVLEPDLRRWLAVDRIEEDLLTAVYLRTRKTIERWGTNWEQTVKSNLLFVDQLALEVYFTALAWQEVSQPNPTLLVEIRRSITSVFLRGWSGEGRESGVGREWLTPEAPGRPKEADVGSTFDGGRFDGSRDSHRDHRPGTDTKEKR